MNVLLIGAQKCGTTSLHNYLHRHPEMHMSQPLKEPGYFLPFDVTKMYYAKKGVQLKNKYHLFNKYMLNGYRNQKLIGESSTFYTNDQFNSSGLVSDIFKYNSKMKLIYLLRNPIDRVISHYLHEVKMRGLATGINEFIESRKDVLGICNYKKQLFAYLKYFKSDQIFPLLFEDMVSENWNNNGLFSFLDVPPVQIALLWDNKSNALDKKELIKKAIDRSHKETLESLKQQQIDFFYQSYKLDFKSWNLI